MSAGPADQRLRSLGPRRFTPLTHRAESAPGPQSPQEARPRPPELMNPAAARDAHVRPPRYPVLQYTVLWYTILCQVP